jgi:flagellar biosynthesis chaperone FliJ
MKRFEFSLERVREWREKRVSIEEARMERLVAELQAVEARRVELERECERNESAVIRAPSVASSELRAIDDFRRYVRAQRRVLANARSDCERKMEDQRQRIVEARREAELLDKLKHRRLRAWKHEFDKEIESQAADAYLAKWRERR